MAVELEPCELKLLIEYLKEVSPHIGIESSDFDVLQRTLG